MQITLLNPCWCPSVNLMRGEWREKERGGTERERMGGGGGEEKEMGRLERGGAGRKTDKLGQKHKVRENYKEIE